MQIWELVWDEICRRDMPIVGASHSTPDTALCTVGYQVDEGVWSMGRNIRETDQEQIITVPLEEISEACAQHSDAQRREVSGAGCVGGCRRAGILKGITGSYLGQKCARLSARELSHCFLSSKCLHG